MFVYGAIGPELEPSDFPIGYGSDFIRGDYPGLSFLSSPIKGGLSGGPPEYLPICFWAFPALITSNFGVF